MQVTAAAMVELAYITSKNKKLSMSCIATSIDKESSTLSFKSCVLCRPYRDHPPEVLFVLCTRAPFEMEGILSVIKLPARHAHGLTIDYDDWASRIVHKLCCRTMLTSAKYKAQYVGVRVGSSSVWSHHATSRCSLLCTLKLQKGDAK